jgi:poly(A) polymerase
MTSTDDLGSLLRDPQLNHLSQLFDNAGYRLYLVGGSVRDLMMGREINDRDLCTSAPPQHVQQLVGRWADDVWPLGEKFGTIACRHDGVDFEITTFRSEKYDPSSRKPVVQYADSVHDDLQRRDFTINAMAADLISGELLDPFDGRMDIERQVLRCPTNPAVCMQQDPLRMMRACRFRAQLGFDLDPQLFAAMSEMSHRLEVVSAERIRDELSKMLVAGNPHWGIEAMDGVGLLKRVLPELSACVGQEQDTRWHTADVFGHIMDVLRQTEPDLDLRLAALLHDIGKPMCAQDGPHGPVFYGHQDVSAELAEAAMRRLRFPTDMIHRVSHLVRMHMRATEPIPWSVKALRRYVRDVGVDNLHDLHRLMAADRAAHHPQQAPQLLQELDGLQSQLQELNSQEPLAGPPPALNGDQVMQLLGLRPGPQVGEVLRALDEAQLDAGPMTEEQATAWLQDWWMRQHLAGEPPAPGSAGLRCRKCGRPISSAESRATGLGPACRHSD